jgi:hypothetical protein
MASTQRAVGPAQESQDEGLEIRNMNRGADVLCFSIAVSPQEDVGLGRSMRYHMPPAAGEGGGIWCRLQDASRALPPMTCLDRPGEGRQGRHRCLGGLSEAHLTGRAGRFQRPLVDDLGGSAGCFSCLIDSYGSAYRQGSWRLIASRKTQRSWRHSLLATPSSLSGHTRRLP